MADTKISALTAIATALSTDRLPAARSPFGAADNGYITPTVLANFVAASGLVATLGTNTFTSRQVITMGTTNLGVIATSGYSLTGTDASNMLDFAGTWNTSGTPTGFKLNITDTASNAASLLMDLQISSVSKFSVTKGGIVTGVSVFGNTVSVAGGTGALMDSGGVKAGAIYAIGFANANNPVNAYDAVFTRVGAGIIKVSNNSTGAGVIVPQPVVVASLPSAATAGNGARAHVTDATAPTFGATVSGGGAVSTPVYSDGTNWKVG